MSSTWKDDRIKPWNPVKGGPGCKYNFNMFKGVNTCIHTMNDESGAWWKGKFGMRVTVTNV